MPAQAAPGLQFQAVVERPAVHQGRFWASLISQQLSASQASTFAFVGLPSVEDSCECSSSGCSLEFEQILDPYMSLSQMQALTRIKCISKSQPSRHLVFFTLLIRARP